MNRRRSLTWQITVLVLAVLILTAGYSMRAHASVENTYNILLIGADRRDESWNGNSDSMILVTVNYDTEQIYMTSFMRDLYADVPGQGVHKLNYAYAYGGADLLEETLESNYGVTIDNYMAVDFVSMANLVDDLGGVDVEVNDSEIPYINSGAEWMVETYGLTNDNGDIESAGLVHLDGVQTVSYCRIRYVGNNDYERTQRQRKVLTAIRTASNSLSTASLDVTVTKVIAATDNDIDAIAALKLVKVINDARYWEQVENRVPYDGMFTSEGEILTPTDMSATVAKLQSLIYADSADEASAAAGDYTITIGNDMNTIMQVQQALNDAGYDCGSVDGYLGANTAQAIEDYQADHNLEQTGMIDEDLLKSLGITQ